MLRIESVCATIVGPELSGDFNLIRGVVESYGCGKLVYRRLWLRAGSTFVGIWAMVRWFERWVDWPMVLGLHRYCRHSRRSDGCDVWSYNWWEPCGFENPIHVDSIPAGGVCLFFVFAMRLMMRIRWLDGVRSGLELLLLLFSARSSPPSSASHLPPFLALHFLQFCATGLPAISTFYTFRSCLASSS